jgi:hypothetical protein
MTRAKQPGRVSVRMPAGLKERVEKAAAEAKLSVNAWAMKCFEVGLTNPLVHLGPPPDHLRDRAPRPEFVEAITFAIEAMSRLPKEHRPESNLKELLDEVSPSDLAFQQQEARRRVDILLRK